MEKSYIDTNILIAYASGVKKEPRQYPKAELIFDEIKKGQFVGVISTLTLIEVKGVLRTIVGRDRSMLQGIDRSKQVDRVKTDANSMYQVLMTPLLQLHNIKFEKGRKTNFQCILDSANKIMDEVRGRVKFYSKCGICNNSYQSSTHKQILVADILHALLAKDIGCDNLITFDKGFHGLIGNQEIDPLQVVVK